MQMRHNAIVTKCKWDKMQKWQNAKIPNISNPNPIQNYAVHRFSSACYE